jgi:hypothetical protein
LALKKVVLDDKLKVVFVVLKFDPVCADRLFDVPDLLIVLV